MTNVVIKSSLSRTTGANSDNVIASIPLPEKSVLLNVSGKCGINYGTGLFPVASVFYYGVSGQIIPVEDPDNVVALDTIFDRFVTKDADWAEDAIDLDTNSAVTSPEFEPGEGNVFDTFNMDAGVRQIYRRRKKLTSVGRPKFLDTTVKWYPDDSFRLNANGKYGTNRHSMVLYAISNPELVDITTTLPVMPSEVEWSMLQYVDTMVEDAWKALTGLADEEAVTITLPYDVAMFFFSSLLEPDLVQESGGFIPDPTTVLSTTDIVATIRVPGDFNMKTLSSH